MCMARLGFPEVRSDGSARRSRVFAAYAIGGLVSGLAFLPLIPIVRALGLPRDSSVAISLFGFMPLLIIVLGGLYRKFWPNLLGVFVCMLTWSLGYALACAIGGFDQIVFGLLHLGLFIVPAYVALALAVYAAAGWGSGRK